MRTTVDIDAPVLKDLKKIQQKERKSLGRIISDLLAQALGERKSAKAPASPPKWISKRMGARIDLADHEALYAAMEREPPPYKTPKSQ
ncbi:MAG: antitoxin [Deltaproteobacteria bacterium]